MVNCSVFYGVYMTYRICHILAYSCIHISDAGPHRNCTSTRVIRGTSTFLLDYEKSTSNENVAESFYIDLKRSHRSFRPQVIQMHLTVPFSGI